MESLWANLEVWSGMIKDTWRTKRWRDKVALWFSTPKWRPADVSEKYPIKKNDLSQFEKFDTKTSCSQNIFHSPCFCQYLYSRRFVQFSNYRLCRFNAHLL